jgi:hypothetical protein
VLAALSAGALATLIAGGWVVWPAWQISGAGNDLLRAVEAHDQLQLNRALETVKTTGGAGAVLPRLLRMLDAKDYQRQRLAFHALFSLDPKAAAMAPVEVTINPGPIRPAGEPMTGATPVVAGDFVEIEWGNQWWAGKVVALAPGGDVHVHYVGWASTFDEIAPRSRLRRPEGQGP